MSLSGLNRQSFFTIPPSYSKINYYSNQIGAKNEKPFFLKNHYTFVRGGLLALTLFASCDNFLKNGQEVKDEVLDAIAYNNAPSCTVSFSAEGMGEFLGNKKETFKVGYAQQVQFEVYLDDWDFTGLEAVTNDSKKTPLTNYVEFESADSDDSNSSRGIYKFNVTVLKESSDILIRPVCR